MAQEKPKQRQKTNQLMILGILGAFFAPVLVAAIILNTGIYQYRTPVNQGELLKPAVQISKLKLSDSHSAKNQPVRLKKGWSVLYFLPLECTDSCRLTLYYIQQAQLAMGPDQSRVNQLLVTFDVKTIPNESILNKQGIHTTVASISSSPLTPTMHASCIEEICPNSVYIVDPLGNIILKYKSASSQNEAVSQGKKLHADLRKLLKLSRIG